MSCNYCFKPLEAEGIELIREEEGVYVVSVYCHQCHRQIGIAMVGVETQDGTTHTFPDPELTEEEIERLSVYEPISCNDVLAAHEFFQNLDGNWMDLIPLEIRERCIDSDTEPQPE